MIDGSLGGSATEPRPERSSRPGSVAKEYAQLMRVIDCDCGKTLQAANDDDLYKAAREHIDEAHPDMQLSDEQVRNLVSERAYEATDS
jgi:predicted small metal-binding protein